MTYTITLTEEQMRVTEAALEEYFRLRMGQDAEFCDDIASMNVDFSPENPKHDKIFDDYINRRDHMRIVMKAFFRIAFGAWCSPKEKTADMMIAECIWDAIRFARGHSRWNQPFAIGSEPVPKIVKEE